MTEYDLIIIGGGPAGLAAAASAAKEGLQNILILEREQEPGGILNQCIHNGFGLHTFQEELTGPEYADRFIRQIQEQNIPCLCQTMVLELGLEEADSQTGFACKTVTAVSREKGLLTLRAKTVILAMGCRERPRGALNIPGYRPAGIYTAGTAQRLVNIEGKMPGKEVVILGSGDIGLIMARRMTLEGAKVHAVAELMPYSGGLVRNLVQCLQDYGIPLKLRHTVVDIQGKDRVESVTLAQVDENRQPIPGTEEVIPCDTLLLSCGLIPENELSRQLPLSLCLATQGPVVNESLETDVPGVFACGNVLHVHDLVDYVSTEAAAAGKKAAALVLSLQRAEAVSERQAHSRTELPITDLPVICTGGIRYTVPQHIRPACMPETLTVRFRTDGIYENCFLSVYAGEKRILHQKKRKLIPGEMQQILLRKADLLPVPETERLLFTIEEA